MCRILVLEDDQAIQMFYDAELAEEGYEVITSDGSHVMEVIQENGPDLILMDIKLGKYDGLELLQDIRNTHYNLPVILCTAYHTFKYDLKSMAADYFVLKSSDLRELKLRIRMALESGTNLSAMNAEAGINNTENTSRLQTRIPW
jgi:DNA-binding response OmpR family regulator